jgi:hypothetical protein
VAAIVEAELTVDASRAARHAEALDRGRTHPRVIGCQPALPSRDPSPAALVPLWLVYEEPPARGDRYFIAYDPDRLCFVVGVWEGHTPWLVGESGPFLDLLDRLHG